MRAPRATRWLITIFLFGFPLGRSLSAQQVKALAYGHKVVSPDNRFVAQLVEAPFPRKHDPPTTCLSIEDQQSKTEALAGVLTPLFAILWTKDSQSMLTVEHIAGGTQTAVLHYRDGEWQRHCIVPLSEDQIGHYAVVGIELGRSRFDVTYKVSDESVRTDVDYYLCKFKIDAQTGAVIHAGSRHEISASTYVRTVFRGRQ